MPETPRPALTRVAVLIPTYNEAENLAGVVERVRSVTPEVDVVVLDDNSPDGTGEIADRLAHLRIGAPVTGSDLSHLHRDQIAADLRRRCMALAAPALKDIDEAYVWPRHVKW